MAVRLALRSGGSLSPAQGGQHAGTRQSVSDPPQTLTERCFLPFGCGVRDFTSVFCYVTSSLSLFLYRTENFMGNFFFLIYFVEV